MGTLSIVATPIGNMEDITLRALRVIKECDVIYAEDTRVTAKLLARYEIRKPVKRLDAITEIRKADEVCDRIDKGENVVYMSDAGTPGVSDPGPRLVAYVREHLVDCVIEAIPGPSALTTALSISGLNITGFTFLGFLPHKKGRQTALHKIAESEIPIILYESPHRILKLLKEIESMPLERVVIARELTKLHEEVLSGSPNELLSHFLEHLESVRGEFVVIIIP